MPTIRVVTEPRTGISVAPTIVLAPTVFDSKALTSAPPATCVVPVTDNLMVQTSSGEVPFGTVVGQLPAHVIPGAEVETMAAANELLAWLATSGHIDFLVVSANPAIILHINEHNFRVRGAIRFSGLESASEIRTTTNAHRARAAIVPTEHLTRATVEALQQRLITVWGIVGAGMEPRTVAHVRAATLGVNGFVTTDAAAAHAALELFPVGKTVLVRKPFIVGHRGMPARAPENTIAGAKLAYTHGANMIETDIHITTDNEIVVHHDPTLERTTTGTGHIESYSFAELQAFDANTQFKHSFPGEKIPSLAQYFETFAGTDVVHFIEIKSENERLVPALANLIRQHEVHDQVVFISFSPEQLRRARLQLPGISQGFLTWGEVQEADPEGSVLRVLHNIQPLSSTYNPRYVGVGAAYLEATKHRGITQWPWTYVDFEPFVEAFLAGMNGLTTNNAYWADAWISRVDATEHTIDLTVGSTRELHAKVTRYDRTKRPSEVTVQVVHGSAITTEGAQVTAIAPGTAYVVLRATQQIDEQRSYTMLSEVITITVRA